MRISNIILWLVGAQFFLLSVANAQLTVLHTFSKGVDNGFSPRGNLVADGNTFYGATESGGPGVTAGIIYKINSDGTGFSIVHAMNNGIDGGSPLGGITLVGNTIYGTTTSDGPNGLGSLFKVNTDGTGFSVLRTIGGQNAVTVDGSTIYGATGGGAGTVYKINTDGTGYSVLHSFNYLDGFRPNSQLVLSGTTLYGTTADGTIYRVNTNGSGFSTLHTFTGGDDGGSPVGGLVTVGSTLYGIDHVYQHVGIYKINTDGTGFGVTALPIELNFTGSLSLYGNTLLGTADGATNDSGTIFSINTDFTGYSLLHSFPLQKNGFGPRSDVLLVNSTLYGTTYGTPFGSSPVVPGTFFALAVPEPNAFLLGLGMLAALIATAYRKKSGDFPRLLRR